MEATNEKWLKSVEQKVNRTVIRCIDPSLPEKQEKDNFLAKASDLEKKIYCKVIEAREDENLYDVRLYEYFFRTATQILHPELPSHARIVVCKDWEIYWRESKFLKFVLYIRSLKK